MNTFTEWYFVYVDLFLFLYVLYIYIYLNIFMEIPVSRMKDRMYTRRKMHKRYTGQTLHHDKNKQKHQKNQKKTEKVLFYLCFSAKKAEWLIRRGKKRLCSACLRHVVEAREPFTNALMACRNHDTHQGSRVSSACTFRYFFFPLKRQVRPLYTRSIRVC